MHLGESGCICVCVSLCVRTVFVYLLFENKLDHWRSAVFPSHKKWILLSHLGLPSGEN